MSLFLLNIKNNKNEIIPNFVPYKDYEIQVTLVTQLQWYLLMGHNPSYFNNGNKTLFHPVETVSYSNINIFLKKLNQIQNIYKYRLPTEKEWISYSGKITKQIENFAWIYENSDKTTHQVALLNPNKIGLYDIYGNVWEFTSTSEGSTRVLRGGSWRNVAQYLRSANRANRGPESRHESVGFRLLREKIF